MPGAGHGRNSAGTVLEEKRQVRRVRAYDCAGLRLLLHFFGRSFAGQTRQGQRVFWILAREPLILFRGVVPSVASRASPFIPARNPPAMEANRSSGEYAQIGSAHVCNPVTV